MDGFNPQLNALMLLLTTIRINIDGKKPEPFFNGFLVSIDLFKELTCCKGFTKSFKLLFYMILFYHAF